MKDDVRSFRPYSEGLAPVSKFAGDYSPEEQRHFRDVFRPHAEHYRRYSLRSLTIGITAFILWMGAIMFFPRAGLGWVCAVLFIGLVGLVVVAWYTKPLLECPACHNPVDSTQLERYCPECGSDQLKPGGWLLTRATLSGRAREKRFPSIASSGVNWQPLSVAGAGLTADTRGFQGKPQPKPQKPTDHRHSLPTLCIE